MEIENMKRFTKRIALVTGLLFTALICMGIVYIDTVNNYWNFSGGFIALTVNTNAQASITVDTNTLRFGINTNNTTRSVMIVGRSPTNANGASGVNNSTIGSIQMISGTGGNSINPTTAGGGQGGNFVFASGDGGSASSATTNASGGNGGTMVVTSGNGSSHTGSVATNSITGGNGGTFQLISGSGGSPDGAATNTVGGNGGAVSLTAGPGGTPTAGRARKSGNGGTFDLTSGSSGNAVQTNSGTGGNLALIAGNSGNVTTGPGNSGSPGSLSLTAGNAGSVVGTGNPSPGANISINGGAGSTGTTNSDGGHVFIVGGVPGSGAVPGNVVVGRNSSGTSRGGLQIGPLVSGGSATITNLLGAMATLDFPNTVTLSDLPITVNGVTSNGCAVAFGVPWQCSQLGGTYTTFCSNDTVFVRLNNDSGGPIDPAPGVFTALVFKVQ